MTQDNQGPELADEISQIQLELDSAQGLTDAPQLDDASQWKALYDMQQQELRSQKAQLAGLSSKIDLGLNAIRRDTEDFAVKQIGDFKTELGRDQILASIDDDAERTRTAAIFRELDRIASVQAPPVPPAPLPPTSPPNASPPNMESVYQVVEGLGLNRSDPRINYAALADVSLTENQRGQAFLNSIKVAIQQPPASSGQQPQPQSQPQSHAPVDEGRGQPADGNYRTPDALYDAYIQGQITTEEYRKRGSALNL
jgi:hypothetical protein